MQAPFHPLFYLLIIFSGCSFSAVSLTLQRQIRQRRHIARSSPDIAVVSDLPDIELDPLEHAALQLHAKLRELEVQRFGVASKQFGMEAKQLPAPAPSAPMPVPMPGPLPAPFFGPLVSEQMCDVAVSMIPAAVSCSLVIFRHEPQGCNCEVQGAICPPADPSLGFTGLSPSESMDVPGFPMTLCMYWQWPWRSSNEALVKSTSAAETKQLAEQYVQTALQNAVKDIPPAVIIPSSSFPFPAPAPGPGPSSTRQKMRIPYSSYGVAIYPRRDIDFDRNLNNPNMGGLENRDGNDHDPAGFASQNQMNPGAGSLNRAGFASPNQMNPGAGSSDGAGFASQNQMNPGAGRSNGGHHRPHHRHLNHGPYASKAELSNKGHQRPTDVTKSWKDSHGIIHVDTEHTWVDENGVVHKETEKTWTDEEGIFHRLVPLEDSFTDEHGIVHKKAEHKWIDENGVSHEEIEESWMDKNGAVHKVPAALHGLHHHHDHGSKEEEGSKDSKDKKNKKKKNYHSWKDEHGNVHVIPPGLSRFLHPIDSPDEVDPEHLAQDQNGKFFRIDLEAATAEAEKAAKAKANKLQKDAHKVAAEVEKKLSK